MAYVYLFLSSLCSLLIAHLLKYTRTTNLNVVHVLTVNYLAAVLFVVFIQFDNVALIAHLTLSGFVFAIGIGAFFIVNFFMYSASVDKNGVGVSVAAMRLSLTIPVLLSIFYYHERLDTITIMGIIMVFIALMLLIPTFSFSMFSLKEQGTVLLIPGLFLLTGVTDAALKVYEEELGNQINELLFMGLVFFSAFLVGLMYIFFTRSWRFTVQELAIGTALGIPNFYSSVFLLWSLPLIEGAVAFSTVNILNVTGGTLLGKFYWNDAITQKQVGGLTLAIVSILLLLLT